MKKFFVNLTIFGALCGICANLNAFSFQSNNHAIFATNGAGYGNALRPTLDIEGAKSIVYFGTIFGYQYTFAKNFALRVYYDMNYRKNSADLLDLGNNVGIAKHFGEHFALEFGIRIPALKYDFNALNRRNYSLGVKFGARF